MGLQDDGGEDREGLVLVLLGNLGLRLSHDRYKCIHEYQEILLLHVHAMESASCA